MLIKPDAVKRRLVGRIIQRVEEKGLLVEALKMFRFSRPQAERFYSVHKGKPFYDSLIAFITSAPVVVQVWEGPNAIAAVRRTLGATNPTEADPGTIRADYGLDVERNLTHGSDGPETAMREIGLFFRPEELLDWARCTDPWILR